ncbi:MAG: serine/threonine-protein kinase [Candidatus Hydrogenedentes bacterium]|nr:serine/threonine-protein kinase [Candidatus Hydrogenedentota bacterium]
MASQMSGHASLIGFAFGGYEVQTLIGRGAMGTVYLARDIALNRQVALKVLLGSIARNPSMVRSFYREAQAAAPLRHPGIVRVYSAGIEGGTPYIAMEYVPGEPLDRFLRRKGQIAWQAALYIGGQVADALQCAHDAGIIHRDVKPANILLDRQGRVRLADFGIARVRTVEQTGAEPSIIGTPQYMSPEQCAGGEVSEKTDLYSLGVTLFQMIAGQPPFKTDSPQALMRLIASESAPRLNRVRPDVPDDVARFVALLLEKNENDRPASARLVCQAIDRLQQEEGGRSAIPQALAAYVREQAQDSPLRLMTPPPSKDKAKPVKPDSTGARTLNRRMLAVTCGVVMTMAVITIVSTGLAMRDTRATVAAQEIGSCQFIPQRDGSVIAALPAPAFQAARLSWAGAEDTLFVEANGVDYAMTRGSAGILALDPVATRCMGLVMPAGATLAEGVDAAAAFPLALTSGQRTATTAPAILLGQRGSINDDTFTGLLFAQQWNEGAPAINPLAAFETVKRKAAPWSEDATAQCLHAVLRPDGGAVCMVIENEDGGNYLAEQRVYGGSPMTPLTGPGARIAPHSVQYTPAGDRVLFLRHDPSGKQELWSAPVSGGHGTLLSIGFFTGEYAISASGDRVAAAWSATPGDQPELRVLDASDGSVVYRLGNATVGHDAWLRASDALVAAVREENGLRQLHVITLATPLDQRTLTSLDQGVGDVTAVSADDRWAAGIAQGKDGVRVVFVDLEVSTPTRTASHAVSIIKDQT